MIFSQLATSRNISLARIRSFCLIQREISFRYSMLCLNSYSKLESLNFFKFLNSISLSQAFVE